MKQQTSARPLLTSNSCLLNRGSFFPPSVKSRDSPLAGISSSLIFSSSPVSPPSGDSVCLPNSECLSVSPYDKKKIEKWNKFQCSCIILSDHTTHPPSKKKREKESKQASRCWSTLVQREGIDKFMEAISSGPK